MSELKPKHKGSRFIMDARTMEIVWGKVPHKSGQLWNGETTTGEKMQLAGDDKGDPTAYWGW